MEDVNAAIEATLTRAGKIFTHVGTLPAMLAKADANLSARLHGVLAKAGGPNAKFSEASAFLFRKQIRLVQEYADKRLLGLTHEQALQAMAKSVKSTVDLAKRLEKRFAGIAKPLALESQAMQDAVTRGEGASLLRQHQTSVARYGKAMIGDFETQLRLGALEGLSNHAVISRLVEVGQFGAVNAAGLHQNEPAWFPSPTSYIKRRYWAERIVRTETAYAYNAAGLRTIQVARETDFPDMQKKILAHFDNRTAPDSIAVHGQVRPVDGYFLDGAGRQYLHPPARPNDRETVIPWRPQWTDTAATASADPVEQAQQAAAALPPPPLPGPEQSPNTTIGNTAALLAKTNAKVLAKKEAQAAAEKAAVERVAKFEAKKAESEAKAKAEAVLVAAKVTAAEKAAAAKATAAEKAAKAAAKKAEKATQKAAAVEAAKIAAAAKVAVKAAQKAAKRIKIDAAKDAKLGMVDLGALKQIGPQKGSNPGALYEDANGVQWYVKTPKSEEHARNEVLAAKLYRAAGVEVPDVELVRHNGVVAVASRIVDGARASQALLTGAVKPDGLYQGFAVDAWLGNWDVVGATYDNLLVLGDGGAARVLRVDTGGALRFRAQGAPKAEAFGPTVGEVSSLRWGSNNPQSVAVFGSLQDRELLASMDRVLATPTKAVTDAVRRFGPRDPGERAALEKVLLARRDDIRAKRAALNTKLRQEAKAKKDPVGSLRVAERHWRQLATTAEREAFLAALHEQKVPGLDAESRDWSGKPSKADFWKLSNDLGKQLRGHEGTAIWRFSQNDYGEIRASERAGNPDENSVALQSGLARGTPVKGLEVWRGIKYITADQVGQFLTGRKFGLGEDGVQGTASTSRHRDKAANFASVDLSPAGTLQHGEPGSGTYKVLLRLRNRVGVAIETISAHRSEFEILQPYKAKFRATKVYRVEGSKRVLVVEAEGVD